MTDRYRAGKRLWSARDDELMRKVYPHISTPKMATRLRRTVEAVYGRAYVLGVRKSAAYLASPDACRLRRGDNVGARFRFQKGQAPPNKGLRRPGWGPGRMKETQFKKGQPPRNHMAVGDTRMVEEYLYMKVSDERHVSWTKNWKPLHHVIWTQAHGPLPPGHVLVFRNGNQLDVRLDNLECITRRALMQRNSVHNLPPELAETVMLLGALNRQLRRRTHGQTQDGRAQGSSV